MIVSMLVIKCAAERVNVFPIISVNYSIVIKLINYELINSFIII